MGLVLDFYLAQIMVTAPEKYKKKILSLAVALNVGILIVYKYFDFLTDNLNGALEMLSIGGIPLAGIILPIGISFITFQKISYLLDVYRGKSEVQEKFVNYGLYIMFFPQLIAGPIVRYNEIAAQIQNRKTTEHIDNRLAGFFRFHDWIGKKGHDCR